MGRRRRPARPPPRPTPEPHRFLPDGASPDWFGRRYCGRTGCGLPETLPSGLTHPVHIAPLVEDTISPRILGERAEEEDAGDHPQ